MYRPFRQALAAKQAHKKRKTRNKRTKMGCHEFIRKTATDTPRVLNAGVGGHDVLGGPEAVKVNFKIA